MSQALASARKRRGIPQQNPVPDVPQNRLGSSVQQQQQPPNINASGLTLPQVISVIDRRLSNLEKFAKDSKESTITSSGVEPQMQTVALPDDILEEFNNRFELLANEINNMKDILLKLQTYTMDVNKTLLEERINVFSDLGVRTNKLNDENILFQEDDLANGDLSSLNLKSLVQQQFSQDYNYTE